MAAIDEMYEMQVYQSRQRGHSKQIFAYIFKKSNNYKDAQLAYLEGEMEEFGLWWIFTKPFNCKDPSSNTLKVILETAEYPPRIKEVNRRKVNGMSFGEKKVLTTPNNATVLAIGIDEGDSRLLTESLRDKFSQLDSSHESRPGVEGDDLTELTHQYICLMLIVYTLCGSFIVRQPRSR